MPMQLQPLPAPSARQPAPQEPARLVEAALAALARGSEAVDIHLVCGAVVRGVLDLRPDGEIVYLSTRFRAWTHSVAAGQIAMVENVARGGWRDGAGWRAALGC